MTASCVMAKSARHGFLVPAFEKAGTVSRGLNFVGFRTWRKTRFVRRHSMHNFSRSLKRNDIPSIVSIIGNAKHSASYNHFCRRMRTERPDLIHQLPERHRYACTNLPLHQSR